LATISEIKKKIDLAIKGIHPAMAKGFESNEEEILDLIRIGQLSIGLDAKNEPITKLPRYTGVYAQTYTSQSVGGWGDVSPRTTKVAGQPYNFTWSGYTMNSFRLDYKDAYLFISNTGSSADYLESFYDNGQDLFKMSEENKQILREEYTIKILKDYLKSIFK